MPDPEGKLVTPVGFDADGYPRAGNLPFTFYDHWYEDLGGTKVGAGTWTANSSAVPTGEIWIVQLVSLANDSGARGAVYLDIVDDGYLCRIGYGASPAQTEPTITHGPIVISAGQYVRARQLSVSDGDTLVGAVFGYKMQL